MSSYVIIGGDAAGMSAAMQIKRIVPDAEVTVLERGSDTSYGACGIPYYFGGEVPAINDLIVVSPGEFREKRGINVLTATEVTRIDAGKKQLTAVTAAREATHAYDKLLIATGSAPIIPPWPGVNLKNIHSIRNLADARRLDTALRASVNRVCIVGAGYVGLEMAEALRKRGLDVTMVEKQPMPLSGVDPAIGNIIAAQLQDNKIRLELDTTVTAFGGTDAVQVVETDRGGIDTDLVLISLGVRPNAGLAADAGIALGAAGSIKVDRQQRTSIEDIYAAGDCVESMHLVTGEPVYLPLALPANRQGRVAGANMAGRNMTMPPVLGSAVTRIFDITVAFTGITPVRARSMGMPHRMYGKQVPSMAHYMREHAQIFLQIAVDPRAGRILGAEMAGADHTIGARINTLATAISNRMTVAEFADLDLAYAPPFNPVWDPILQVVNRASLDLGSG